jgi:hypothetical protein
MVRQLAQEPQIVEHEMSNVEGPSRNMATKSRENARQTAWPDIGQGPGKSGNAVPRLARLLVLFCDFSWPSLAHHPSKFDIPCSAFFGSGAEGG